MVEQTALTPEILRELYVTQGMTEGEIAKVNRNHVTRVWMSRGTPFSSTR